MSQSKVVVATLIVSCTVFLTFPMRAFPGPGGDFDKSFGTNGVTTLDTSILDDLKTPEVDESSPSLDETVASFAFLDDLGFFAAGTSHNMQRYLLARFNVKGFVEAKSNDYAGKVLFDMGEAVGGELFMDVLLESNSKENKKVWAAGTLGSQAVVTRFDLQPTNSASLFYPSPDLSFGDKGKKILDAFPPISIPSFSISLAKVGNKTEVALGMEASICLARFDGQGLDANFGTNGTMHIDLPQFDLPPFNIPQSQARISDVQIFPDGTMVVGGFIFSGNPDLSECSNDNHQSYFLGRFSADGLPLPSFGQDGFVIRSWTAEEGVCSQICDVTRDQNDAILAAGAQFTGVEEGGFNYINDVDGILLRVKSDGSPDPGFGQNGQVRINGMGEVDFRKVKVAKDGKIVVMGLKNFYTGGAFVQRFLKDGTVDPSFGVADEALDTPHVDIPQIMIMPASPGTLAIGPDGRILVGGRGESDEYGNMNLAIARLLGIVSDLRVPVFSMPSMKTKEASTCIITVKNHGPDTAFGSKLNVTIKHNENEKITPKIVSKTQGSCTAGVGKINCNLGNITSGKAATIKFTMKPTETGKITGVATASVASSYDHISKNNKVTKKTTVKK